VREVDTVSRLSGDEFTIILGQIDDQLTVQRVCQHILDTLSEPLKLENEIVYQTASIGVSFYPDDADNTDVLQRNADQAMYAAKASGRNRFKFYTSELQERAQRKRQMIADLHEAVNQSEFEVYYQPVVNLLDDSMFRAEALLRWHHPQAGMVSPAVFIPIAEETGLINAIGNWVFYQATQQVNLWRKQFDNDFQISINTSPLQWIEEAGGMNQWFTHLVEQGIDGTALSVEVTEDLLMDANDRITNRLLEFRDANIQVAIDDFGTGYSSLSYLKHFDIDYIKIDQSFVRNLDQEENDLALCEAMIVMAHKLDIQVIAEGVETKSQDRILREIGCDYGQGYLYSRPISALDFTALIASRT
jgi:EAL domain-containing protein (putative c-di-GMP-specific phosphodiesterase class I)